MRRILPALTLSSALVLGGCQNPDGSFNAPNTLLLGAGIAAGAALIAAAATPQRPRAYAGGYGYRGGYGGGWGPRPGYGYRGW